MQQRMDSLRRIHVPVEFCRNLGVDKGDELQITIEYGKIHIRKFCRKDIEKQKYIGVVRELQSVCRITIPAEYTRVLGIKIGDPILTCMKGDAIVVSLKEV